MTMSIASQLSPIEYIIDKALVEISINFHVE